MNITAKSIYQSNRSSGLPKLTPGFHENADFTGADMEVGKHVDLNFEKDGKIQHRRVWWYDPEKVTTRDGETLEEAQERDRSEKLVPVTDLLKIFLTKEEFDNFSASSYDAYIQKAVADLNKRKGKAKVNLKLIPDSSLRYSEFPRYGEWVQPYVDGITHTFTYSPWELKNRINVTNPSLNTDKTVLEDKDEYSLF